MSGMAAVKQRSAVLSVFRVYGDVVATHIGLGFFA